MNRVSLGTENNTQMPRFNSNDFGNYAGNGKRLAEGNVSLQSRTTISIGEGVGKTVIDFSQLSTALFHTDTHQDTEAERTKQEFETLVKEWKAATAHFSSERQQTAHLSFLRIAVLGEKALPLILNEFRREPMSGWLSVLEAFAGKDVASNATTYREAIGCWINWGKDKGYLKS